MSLTLSIDHILAVAPSHSDPAAVVAALAGVVARHEIDQTPERLGMFLAQWAHESSFICRAENLNYSARRLTQVWPNRFTSLTAAEPYANNPQALANRVYNGRMGNAPGSNDGWTYRGRGWPQLTGRDAYATYGRLLGLDLERNPDLLLHPEVSAAVCGAFWAARGLNRHADQGDMIRVTEAINGGRNGLDDRLVRYRAVIGLLREQAQAAPQVVTPPAEPPAPEPEPSPFRRLFVNGVEVLPGGGLLGEGTVTLPSGVHEIERRSQVGDKLYVVTS